MTYLHVVLFICLGGILPVFLAKYFQPMRFIGAMTITAGCVVGFVLSILDLYSGRVASFPYQLSTNLSFSFKIDPMAVFFLAPLFLVGAAAAFYSYHYLDDRQKKNRIAIHYLFLALLIVSMAGVVLAGSMISFAFFWEAMSVASAVLVLFDYEQDDNRQAAFRYFLYTQVGGLFIFVAFGLLFSSSGTFELLVPDGLSPSLRLTIFLIAMVGFGSKAGLIPLHVWLPYAHPAAPSHVSALMSGVMIKLGIYGLLRMFILLTPDPTLIGRIFIIVGAVSGVMGIVYALGQQNLKRLLAYSSVENIGIIFLGCGIGFIGIANGNMTMAMLGLAGGLLHVWNHALFKSILFMGAGSILHGTGTPVLDRLGGLLKTMPTTGRVFLVGAIAICGLPPLNGFVSEFLIYAAGFQGVGERRLDFLFTVLVILSITVIGGLAIACFTKVFGVVFLGEPRKNDGGQVHEAKVTMLLPMVVLALFCLAIGLAPVFFIQPALTVAGMFSNQPMPATFPALNLCRNIALGGGGFLLLFSALYLLRRFFYRNKVINYGPTWGCGFNRPTVRMQYTATSFARSFILLFRPFATLVYKYDKIDTVFPSKSTYHSKVHDIVELFGERFISKPIAWCSAKLRLIQHGNIQIYIAYIVLAVIILLLFQIM